MADGETVEQPDMIKSNDQVIASERTTEESDKHPVTTRPSRNPTNGDEAKKIAVQTRQQKDEPSPKEGREKNQDSDTNLISCSSDIPKKPSTASIKKRPSQLGALASGTRKKRKSQLAEMSAAATAQPVKLNTLEKSKLDWESFKGTVPTSEGTETMTDAERDELEAQTHGGGSGLGNVKGYLHRKEFLDRVHNRLDTQEYDAHYS